MGAVGLVFGAEFRRRWRSWLILAVLIAVVAGLVLAAAAAGRRTATAFPRFVAAHGYDVYIYNNTPVPKLSTLPGVASITSVGIPASGQPTCACTHVINSSDFYINELTTTALNRVVKLVAGRMPTQSSSDQVLASFTLQQDYGVHIGTVIHIRLYSSSQRQALIGGVNEAASGPMVALHVVGIEAAESEFPSGTGPELRAVHHPGVRTRLEQAHRACLGIPRPAASRDGRPSPIRRRHQRSALGLRLQNQDTAAAAVAASIHPQAVGWWVLAVLAGAGRPGRRRPGARSPERRRERGVPHLGRPGLAPAPAGGCSGTARNLLVALAGAAGAVFVAFALSPLTPVGEARLAEPSHWLCLRPSWSSCSGRWPQWSWCWSWASGRRCAPRGCDIGDDPVPDSPVSDRGPHGCYRCAPERGDRRPPRARAGTWCRLGPGGNRSVRHGIGRHGPVRDGRLRGQPVAPDGHPCALRPGLPADVREQWAGAGNPTTEVATLEHDRSITGIMVAPEKRSRSTGSASAAVTGKAVRGPLLLSTVSGRLPAGNGEIALGTTTMHQVGAHVGSVVHVTVQVPTGGTRTAAFRVVGTASFPSKFGLGGLGTGAAFTFADYLNALCPPGPTQSRCQSTYTNESIAVLARVTPGPKGRAAINRYISKGSATRRNDAHFTDQLRRGGELPAHRRIDAGTVRCSNAYAPAGGQRGPPSARDRPAEGARVRQRPSWRGRVLAGDAPSPWWESLSASRWALPWDRRCGGRLPPTWARCPLPPCRCG